MRVAELKLLLALAIFITGLASSLAPLAIASASPDAFSVGNMMSSGVLLAAALTHELPESTSSLSPGDGDGGFPWPGAIAGLTFIAFLVLETAVHLRLGGANEYVHRDEVELVPLDDPDYYYDDGDGDCDRPGGGPPDRGRPPRKPRPEEPQLSGPALASLLLLSALSLHSVLAGMSVGVSAGAESAVSATAAVLAHKAFAGYALGCSVAASGVGARRHALLGAAFASATPLGILAGMALPGGDARSEGGDGGGAIVGIVQAAVAGTFLYVSIVEVGTKELLVCRPAGGGRGGRGGGGAEAGVGSVEAAKLAAFLIGFASMSGLAFFI